MNELLQAWPDEARPIRKSRLPYVEHLEVVLHHLAMALSRPDSNGVAISQSPERYGKDNYAGISYDRMKRIIRMLTGKGVDPESAPTPASGLHWCRIDGGTFDRVSEKGLVSRLYANSELADRMVAAGSVFYGHPNWKPKRNTSKLGVLRLNKGKEDHTRLSVEPEEEVSKFALTRDLTEREAVIPLLTKRLRREKPEIVLETYEQYRSSLRWDHKTQKLVSKIVSWNDELYRSFSLKDGLGGRIYGHWIQNIPSDFRPFIRFKGQKTVEYDYKSMQPALAFSQIGKSFEGDDLYEVPGYPLSQYRNKFKLVFRVSVGCGADVDVVSKVRGVLFAEGFQPQPGEAEELYNAFWDHHADIAHFAGCDAWTWLQKMDSDISLDVIKRLLDQDIPCAPIFDSFLVAERHEAALEQAMIEAVSGLSSPPKPVKKF